MALQLTSERIGAGQIALSTFGTLALLVISVATISKSNSGPILALGGAAGLAYVALWGDVREACLLGFFATLPIMIGKALIDGSPTLAPPGFYYTAPDTFMVPLAIACLVTRRSLPVPRPKPTEVHWGLIFALWLFLSTLIMARQNLLVAVLTYLRYIIAGYTLAYAVRSPRDVRLVLYGLALGMVVQVGVAGYQYASKSLVHIPGLLQATIGVNLDLAGSDAFRPSGLTGHPLSLGDYLTYLLPTMLALFVAGPSRVGRSRYIVNCLLMVLGSGALLLTLARSAWLAMAVAVVLMIIIGVRVGLVRGRHLFALLGLTIIALIGIWIVYPTFYERLFTGDSYSTLTRFLMWEQAIKIMGEYPFFGVGWAEYNDMAQIIRPADFASYSSDYIATVTAGVVHCKYLLVGAEEGIPGLLLFLWLVWKGVRWTFPIRQWRDPMLFVVVLGITGTMAAQIVYFGLDHVFSDMRITMYYSFLGLAAALRALNLRIACEQDGVRLAQPSYA